MTPASSGLVVILCRLVGWLVRHKFINPSEENFGYDEFQCYIWFLKSFVMENNKEKKVEYFTDEMHRNMFVFQDSMSNTSAGKPVMKSVTIKPPKSIKAKIL